LNRQERQEFSCLLFTTEDTEGAEDFFLFLSSLWKAQRLPAGILVNLAKKNAAVFPS